MQDLFKYIKVFAERGKDIKSTDESIIDDFSLEIWNQKYRYKDESQYEFYARTAKELTKAFSDRLNGKTRFETSRAVTSRRYQRDGHGCHSQWC